MSAVSDTKSAKPDWRSIFDPIFAKKNFSHSFKESLYQAFNAADDLARNSTLASHLEDAEIRVIVFDRVIGLMSKALSSKQEQNLKENPDLDHFGAISADSCHRSEELICKYGDVYCAWVVDDHPDAMLYLCNLIRSVFYKKEESPSSLRGIDFYRGFDSKTPEGCPYLPFKFLGITFHMTIEFDALQSFMVETMRRGSLSKFRGDDALKLRYLHSQLFLRTIADELQLFSQNPLESASIKDAYQTLCTACKDEYEENRKSFLPETAKLHAMVQKVNGEPRIIHNAEDTDFQGKSKCVIL
jgi:hypothetical protein